MKTTQAFRALLWAATVAGSLLMGCSKDDTEDAPAADGSIGWTHNGKAYTSTTYASVVVDGPDDLILTGGTEDQQNIVSLNLVGLDTRGPGTYELKQGSILNGYSMGSILLGGSTGQRYATLYGGSAVNGTVTVTQYDKAAQKIAGTFSFTAGAVPNSGASGTQGVTNGSFSFTRFH